MNPISYRLSFRHMAAWLVLAAITVAALPVLSGCKPNSPAAAGIERPAERPELNALVFETIIADDEQAAIDLIEQGASPEAVNERGVSVLHFAARATMPNLTRRLLEYGADVAADIPAPDGTASGIQPIHWAARAGANDREGAEETIDVLLEFGADINARTTAGGTLPIEYAIQLGNERWREFLISRGSLPQ